MLSEIQESLEHLRALRAQVLQTLAGLNADALNWSPTRENTNSLYVLATHCIGSEHGWIYEILGRGAQTRNRPAEFGAMADLAAQGNELTALRAQYEKVAQETETLLATRTAQDLLTTRYRTPYGDVSERWIILHVIEHYSEHLGQMYLTRQLWETNWNLEVRS